MTERDPFSRARSSKHDKPLLIVSDNGTELTSNAMLKWTAINGIEWHYIAG
jgi:putative transposase